MEQHSTHLEEIVERHNRTCNALLAFVDVESYSKRRTLAQINVIDALTQGMAEALEAVAKRHIDYAQTNNLNFRMDVVRIPTGDGAAIAFTFAGLHSVHLEFSLELLQNLWQQRATVPCELFDANGWCNCHPYLNLRIGIGEGKAIIYKDLNGNFNVAGNAINLASRVMGLADRNQIMFTESAYEQVVDMSDDPTFMNPFVEFKDVRIKHGEKIKVYQYVGVHDESFVNKEPPENLFMREQMLGMLKRMKATGLPFPDPEAIDQLDKRAMLVAMEKFMSTLTHLGDTANSLSAPKAISSASSKQEQKEGIKRSRVPPSGEEKDSEKKTK